MKCVFLVACLLTCLAGATASEPAQVLSGILEPVQAISSALEPVQGAPETDINGNNIVDFILESLRQEIIATGQEQLKMPDLSERFTTKMKASWLCLLLVAGSSLGARILGIFPTPSPSHHFTYQTLMKALVARGHHVTVLSPDPLKTPLANYTDIDLSFCYVYLNKLLADLSKGEGGLLVEIQAMLRTRFDLVDMQLSSKGVQEFIKSNPKFDLVFYEDVMYHAYFGLIHHVGSPPIIAIHTFDVTPIFLDAMGNPSNPSYDPNFMLEHTDDMNFPKRVLNTAVMVLSRYLVAWHIRPSQEGLMRKHFGNGPPRVVDTAKNYSLYMVNRNDVLSYPRPLLPTFIGIGGLHLNPKINRLPKDLQDYVEGAKHGFIYFSFGSNVKSFMISKKLRQGFLDAFAELPQRVLLKWEDDTLPGLPKNVKLSKWLPQQELLAHPNIRLFITHGGLQSIYETVYHAVPVVGFPVISDQPHNVLKIVTEGAGLSLDYKTAAKEDILNALKSVLTDPRYRKNMQRLSTLLKDQPETPLQRAVWWTEYVLRHNGAKHLRSAALDLAWYQYYLLDVAALIIGVIALVLALVYVTVKALLVCVIRPSNDKLKCA